jgi:hypothetical protein
MMQATGTKYQSAPQLKTMSINQQKVSVSKERSRLDLNHVPKKVLD